jgi:signal peptidase I
VDITPFSKRLLWRVIRILKYLQRKQFLFPNHPFFQWTITDFGPYYIPRKGDTMKLTKSNTILYKTLIEYESGKEPIILKSYTFKNNYYFVAGDNLFSSKDSRYFGVIPEDYIIGVVTNVIPGK